jgi:hypothetical protein
MTMVGLISRSRRSSSREHELTASIRLAREGLLGDLTKQILKTGLEVKMDQHLGHTKHDAAGRTGGNSRNGTRSWTVITEVGPVDIGERCHAPRLSAPHRCPARGLRLP